MATVVLAQVHRIVLSDHMFFFPIDADMCLVEVGVYSLSQGNASSCLLRMFKVELLPIR